MGASVSPLGGGTRSGNKGSVVRQSERLSLKSLFNICGHLFLDVQLKFQENSFRVLFYWEKKKKKKSSLCAIPRVSQHTLHPGGICVNCIGWILVIIRTWQSASPQPPTSSFLIGGCSSGLLLKAAHHMKKESGHLKVCVQCLCVIVADLYRTNLFLFIQQWTLFF